MQSSRYDDRELGATGLKVTRLGLGMAAIGRPAYMTLEHDKDLDGAVSPEALQAHAHRVLNAAHQEGIRYYDTARSYGKGEAFLGNWLRGHDTEGVVASKWGYAYVGDFRLDVPVHEEKEHSVARFAKQLEESREELGERLQVYQVHSATFLSGVFENTDLLSRLGALRDSGVIVGVTVTGAEQTDLIRAAVNVRVGGKPLFGVIQATWNLLEQSASRALLEAREAGVGIVVKEPLANGVLTDRCPDPELLAVLQRQSVRRGVSIDALSLSAVLAQPWADVVLSGAATEAQVRSNARAAATLWDDEAEASLSRFARAPGEYWPKRAQLPWS